MLEYLAAQMAKSLADQMVDLSRKDISFFFNSTHTRAKKSAGRRGIPPHTPPAAHALTTRRSAAGGEGATPQKLESRSDTTFFHFNY